MWIFYKVFYRLGSGKKSGFFGWFGLGSGRKEA